MQNPLSPRRSPTSGLLLGLVITLAAVLAYASYITVQLAGLRKLQSEMVDRNRKDSLQLLRIQNDLNSIALAMRDKLDTTEPYPLTAWSAAVKWTGSPASPRVKPSPSRKEKGSLLHGLT